MTNTVIQQIAQIRNGKNHGKRAQFPYDHNKITQNDGPNTKSNLAVSGKTCHAEMLCKLPYKHWISTS
jgi:hypothetical protein